MSYRDSFPLGDGRGGDEVFLNFYIPFRRYPTSMEGPSLRIACEEFAPFLGKRIRSVSGSASVAKLPLVGRVFKSVDSWGKHLHLRFGNHRLRIHFLMFGSYRIDDPRENRFPKLELEFGKSRLYFCSCAIGPVDAR